MANGDEATFAEDLQHSRQQPLNGMRAQRSRRQLSTEGACHAGHSFEESTRLNLPGHIAGVSVAPRWHLHAWHRFRSGLSNYFHARTVRCASRSCEA